MQTENAVIDTNAAPALDANDAAALPAPANETKDERDLRIAALERENAKLERRIGRKTHALGQAHERLSTYERSAPQRAATTNDADPDENDDADAVETRAQQLANERLQAREQQERSQRIATSVRTMVETGEKLDPKFRELVNDLAQDIPMMDERGRATDFTVELLGCDNPAAVALYLVKNPAIAQSLEGMNARQMARKLDRIDAEVGKTTTATPSGAARPLATLNGGTSAANGPSDSDSPEEWRRKEVARLNAKRQPQQAAASR